jgi:hypothetical protein
LKENASPFSTPTPAPQKSIPRSQEQPLTAGPPAPVSEIPVSSTNANENNSNKESEGVLFVIIVPMFMLVNSQCDLHSSSCDYSLQVY